MAAQPEASTVVRATVASTAVVAALLEVVATEVAAEATVADSTRSIQLNPAKSERARWANANVGPVRRSSRSGGQCDSLAVAIKPPSITSDMPLTVLREAPSALAALGSAPTRRASAPVASVETAAAVSELRPDPPVLPADFQCRSAHQRQTRDAD